MKKVRILVAIILFVGVMGAMAQTTETPVVDKRQRAQRSRIREGVASGELTRGEAAQSRSDQRKVRRTERRAKADGEVTKGEQARITRKQNKASRKLRSNKHDSQQRP